MYFDTEKDIIDYVSDPMYEREEGREGLCGAITYIGD